MSARAFSKLDLISNESLASTSVETRPGTISRMDTPNLTRSESITASPSVTPSLFALKTTSSTKSEY